MIPKTRINLKPSHPSEPEMALKTRKRGHLDKPRSQLTSVISPQGVPDLCHQRRLFWSYLAHPEWTPALQRQDPP